MADEEISQETDDQDKKTEVEDTGGGTVGSGGISGGKKQVEVEIEVENGKDSIIRAGD